MRAEVPTPPAPSTELTRSTPATWSFRLYVAGESPKSVAAFAHLSALCRTHLSDTYEIEVVDLLTDPRLARQDDILAIPTLVRDRPTPSRKVIGDLSDTARVLAGLQIPAAIP